MTSQENLPVWAKILLGIPVANEPVSGNSGTKHTAADCQQSPAPREHQEHKQSVLVFNPTGGNRKRKWHGLMCPVPGKLGS